jgi:hypothetical protein
VIVATWRAFGGNREVPPPEILGGAAAYSGEEGGWWGKHGFPRGSEASANDAATVNALVTAACVVAIS